MSKSSLVVFFLLVSICSLTAQDESTEILKKWENSAQYTISLIDSMPAEAFEFRPTPEIRSFKEQLVHMVGNMTWLSSDYLGAEEFNMEEPSSKEECLAYMRAACDYSALAMEAALKDTALLNAEQDFFAGPKTGRQIIWLMHDHVTHHRGQMIIYLRMHGIEPPRYSGW